jgi:hypothetical protein
MAQIQHFSVLPDIDGAGRETQGNGIENDQDTAPCYGFEQGKSPGSPFHKFDRPVPVALPFCQTVNEVNSHAIIPEKRIADAEDEDGRASLGVVRQFSPPPASFHPPS